MATLWCAEDHRLRASAGYQIVHDSGSDARGAYTGTVVSSETVGASQSGNADTGSSSSANWRSGTQTVSVAGGSGTQTYSASTVLQTSDNGTAWVVGTSGANGSANTHAATQTNSESGSAAGATYALGWTSTAGATDTASTSPADGRATNTHAEWSTASLHETGSTDASHWYTLDKTDSKWAGSTRTGQVGGRFSATGSHGETSTAIESNAHGANTATFTEILSDTASTTAIGNAAAKNRASKVEKGIAR